MGYKCGHLGLCDFDFLNSHIDWNMSCELMFVRGLQMRYPLEKCQSSAILDEELMECTAFVDTDNMTYLYSSMTSILENQGHFKTTNIDAVSSVRSDICVCLRCAVYFIEETTRFSLKIKITRQLSQRIKGV